MQNKAFIYIPDISGFTKFITETEISHSEHIISELLGVILDSNILNLNVSEIEGDAVLFYKLDSPPSLAEIYQQSKEMFINFHSYLKQIEKDTICQCGACKTASNLTLKFIGHLGDFKEVSIQSFTKLIGSDVILAHRLLKNNVQSKEYLLFTDSYLKFQDESKLPFEDDLKFEKNVENFENFGEISTKFINFSCLLKLIPKSSESNKLKEGNENPDSSTVINAPILFVHEKLIDLDAKLEWVPNIKGVKKDTRINRVNSSHICSFDKKEISFITTESKTSKGKIRFSERATISPDISIDNFYNLVENNGMTELSISFQPVKSNYANMNWFQKTLNILKFKIILIVLHRSSKKTLLAFKNYCEKKHS
ncbi:MAG: DUF2652 domain-containing protein [Ignavibacteriae bacterium]|nr:DUF2652 domain-containing protein [Ignavibacteriota bacterium]